MKRHYLTSWISLGVFSFVLLGQGLASKIACGEERPATILLITDESLAESWERFVYWKTRCGKPTTLVTVQDIIEEYEGVDCQAKIRQCELNLLGDPTLSMHPIAPVELEVDAPEIISPGEQNIRIEVCHSNRALPEMSVCLWMGDELYITKTTDVNGVAVFDVAPTTSGEILVTVRGPNTNVWGRSIRVDQPDPT